MNSITFRRRILLILTVTLVSPESRLSGQGWPNTDSVTSAIREAA